MRRNILRLVGALLICCFGCERSLTIDAQGVAHGTGEKVYNCPSGASPVARRGSHDGV